LKLDSHVVDALDQLISGKAKFFLGKAFLLPFYKEGGRPKEQREWFCNSLILSYFKKENCDISKLKTK
tara:strand:- start:213 stop:416 length:204 start_codon:yes stop_codon:yes gene_type:complete